MIVCMCQYLVHALTSKVGVINSNLCTWMWWVPKTITTYSIFYMPLTIRKIWISLSKIYNTKKKTTWLAFICQIYFNTSLKYIFHYVSTSSLSSEKSFRWCQLFMSHQKKIIVCGCFVTSDKSWSTTVSQCTWVNQCRICLALWDH